MDESTQLLRRYADHGDQFAFARLVDRMAPLVYSVALRQVGGDEHLAKDVTQKVFIDLARKAMNLSSHATLDGWLYRAASLAAAAMVRGEQRRRNRELQSEIMEKQLSTDPQDFRWKGTRPALDRAINALNDRERDAVVLRFYESRSFADIGQVLNVSADAARMRVDRALEKMRRMLARQGMTSTTVALAAALANQVPAAVPAGLSTAVAAGVSAGTAAFGSANLVLRLINFMSATKLGLGIAGMVSLAAVSSAVYETSAARKAEAALATANQIHDSDQAKLAQLSRQAADDDKKWAELQDAVDRMRTAAEAAQNRETSGRRRTAAEVKAIQTAVLTKALVDGQAFLAANPQARAMLSQIQAAQITRNYAAFFRKAGLTSAQVDNFVNQTSEQWFATLMVTPNSIHPAEPQLADGQLKEILGDQGYQQFQSYERIQPLVKTVNDASSLSVSAPFTETQSDQLLALLANASGSYQSGANATPQSVDWSQVLPQAQGFLSEAQVNSLRAEAQLPQVLSMVGQFYKARRAAK